MKKLLYGDVYANAIRRVESLGIEDLNAVRELLYSGCPPCDACNRLVLYIDDLVKKKYAEEALR